MENLQKFKKALEVAEGVMKNTDLRISVVEIYGPEILINFNNYQRVVRVAIEDLEQDAAEIVANLEHREKERKEKEAAEEARLEVLRGIPEVMEYVNLAAKRGLF